MRTTFLKTTFVAGLAAACSAPSDAVKTPDLQPRVVASVSISPPSLSIQVGKSLQLTAAARDSDGDPIQNRTAHWSSGDTTLLSVSASGMTTALKVGSTTVSATIDSKTAAAPVSITSTAVASHVDTIFMESFESGDLSHWDDGVDPTKEHVINDATLAHTGSHVLEVDYPANGTGGWLTHFFMPGYDSVYARMWVRLAPDWVGGSKLLLLRGSRTDNEWSAFGIAGLCPVGTDFFATNIIMDTNGDPGTLRFYTYYPEMARESDGVTCWGRYGDAVTPTNTQYLPEMSLPRDSWQEIGFWVRLNTPGLHDGVQKFWINGILRGVWSNLSYRTSTILKLNSASIELSTAASVPRRLWIDDILVTTVSPYP